MFGFSVFLGSDMSEETKKYIRTMSKNGFIGIFTSMHIPEDDSSKYLARMTQLGNLAKELQLKVMVDISTKGLSTLGLDLENHLDKVTDLGITGLRMDYGIPMETIANASKEITIGLNASTLSQQDIDELIHYQANFSNMEFWHNYYPRIETGLDREEFIQKNRWLQQLGGKIVAFAPGDDILRGPLFDRLPTLEAHRYSHPLAASIDLLEDCFVDDVYIGDEKITNYTIKQFSTYDKEQTILLHCHLLNTEYEDLVTAPHTNRMDTARDVVRSQEARFRKIPLIKQLNTIPRTFGSITLDNHLYGRYMGEFQITKRDLAADSRVNVMGKIDESDLSLIPLIKDGQKYKLIRKD